ncbi:MAG: class I SAM-dependent methyltransferase [Acidobacteriaceae bacterium]|nr:class I SAM-dependent methyltransferase [Acidobacteriaceae bacterium]
MLEKLRNLFQPELLQPGEEASRLAAYSPPADQPVAPRELTRTSNGLEQFFQALDRQDRLKILDLCGAPATIEFLFEQQQIPRPDPFYRALELAFGDGPDYLDRQLEEDRVQIFTEHTLDHKEGEFDAVLLWDCLQYLRPELLGPVLEQIRAITRPGAPLFAIFHADDRAEEIPVFSYQIQARNQLYLAERDRRRPAQYFSNQTIEGIFRNFGPRKFFLARDQMREVLIWR